jgi:hypothetical protein
MAIATDIQADLFTGLSGLYTADTASGGLANTSDSNSAYVYRFIQEADPSYDEDRAVNLRAQIVVAISERDEPPLGTASDATAAEMVVRMRVLTRRDKNRTYQNAVNSRVRTVFDGVSVTSPNKWLFSALSRVGGRQLRPTPKLQRYEHIFVCGASYELTDTGAPVLGRSVILTFSSNLGITSKMEAKVVSLSMNSPTRGVTRWADTAERMTRRAQQVRMRVRFGVRVGWPELVAIAQRPDSLRVDVGGTAFDLTNTVVEGIRITGQSPSMTQVELDLAGTTEGVAGSLITR